MCSLAQGFTEPEVLLEMQLPGGRGVGGGGLLGSLLKPLERFMSRAGGDPFYGVVAYRNFKPEYE